MCFYLYRYIIRIIRSDQLTQHYQYDDNGRLITQTNVMGNQGRYAYDGIGNLIMVTNALGESVKFEYNNKGLHTAMIDPLGNRTAFIPLPGKLPQNKTQMHLMSQTYKGRGYNGMLMEDMKGKQRLDLHAQHDMNTLVLNDRTTNVGGNHTETVKGEQKISVNQSRYKEVVGDEVQIIGKNQEIYVGQDYQLNVTGGLLMKSGTDNILFETTGAKLTLFKDGILT